MGKPKIVAYVSIKDTDVFENLVERVTGFLTDERIDESIRQEHYDKIAQFLPVEGCVQ